MSPSEGLFLHHLLEAMELGKKLMTKSIESSLELFPNQPIKISAQCYLIKFYESFGFEAIGEEYLEDNIPHIAMIRKNQ